MPDQDAQIAEAQRAAEATAAGTGQPSLARRLLAASRQAEAGAPPVPAVPSGSAATSPPPPAQPPAPATPIVPPPVDATPPPVVDQAAIEARIRAEVEAEQAAAAAAATPAGTAPPVVSELPPEWPCKGYSGPQPWQVSNPPELSHDRGLIQSGSAGELVVELGATLGALGYANEIADGKNPHAIFGKSELAALEAFRNEFGVVEDPAIIRATMPSVVGPWTWEALFRALRSEVETGWPEGAPEA